MSQKVQEEVDAMVLRLRQRRLVGSLETALETLRVIRLIVSHSKYSNAQHLIDLIKFHAKKLQSAMPIELALSNIVARILFLVRQEYLQCHPGLQDEHDIKEDPCFRFIASSELLDFSRDSNLKAGVIEGIKEIIDECTESHNSIAMLSLDHIHSKYLLLI